MTMTPTVRPSGLNLSDTKEQRLSTPINHTKYSETLKYVSLSPSKSILDTKSTAYTQDFGAVGDGVTDDTLAIK